MASNGLHSNGFSLVRKALGPKGIKKHAKELLAPTRIYVNPILSLLKTYNLKLETIKGIAHITGGAFYNKATKILPKGYGMVIERKSWKVPQIFKLIQDKANIEDREMYTVFNMGIGMILVVEKRASKAVINSLRRINLKAYIIGGIVKSKEKIKLL